jgi:glycosyltransferase involved in cell wall biosynthesis
MENHSKKSVLFVITKSNFGGAQKYVYELACEAHVRGYEVLVACGGTGEAGAPTGELASRLHEVGIQTIHITSFQRDMSMWQDVKSCYELFRIILKNRPHVLHLTSSKAGGVGALIGRLLFVRNIIFTSHGLTMDEAWRPVWQRILISIATWITLSLAHQSIMINRETFERASSLPGLKRKVTLIHNGIAEFTPLPRKDALASLSLSVPRNSVIIGGIGELHPNKQWHTLIETLKYLPDQTHLVIIGEGEERKKLETLATQHNVANRVHLLGYVSEAKLLLSVFDIFILPSAKEGLPYVLLEAGVSGCAVIASDLPGNRDIIESGKDGLLVNPQSAEFSTSITMLIRDTGIRRRLAESLHERVTTEFSLTRMFDETFSLYLLRL